jgi:general secretion pathway protein A
MLRHFGLTDNPFGVTPEPRFLYPTGTHREALASLQYGFYSNRGFTALVAPPGLGKTTLLHAFLADVRATARTVYLFNIDGQCSPKELIASVLRDLGIVPASNLSELYDQLNASLAEEARAGRIVVVVVDEAQNLSDEALEFLRTLSNFETASAKLIHIVMAGQPQLSEKLMQPNLVQLRQRITTVCHIDPLSPDETRAYIQHRLQLAGYRGEPLFSEDAMSLIAAVSAGTPRTINTLCFNSLSICRALNEKQVTAGMVEEAVADLELIRKTDNGVAASSQRIAQTEAGTSEAARGVRLGRTWGLAAAAILLIGVVGFTGLRAVQSRQIPQAQAAVSKPLPAASAVSKPETIENPKAETPALAAEPFQVRVARHETLRDIALKYLGDFDGKRLREIRALNPKLNNPNHIVPGQTIWLPGPPSRQSGSI